MKYVVIFLKIETMPTLVMINNDFEHEDELLFVQTIHTIIVTLIV